MISERSLAESHTSIWGELAPNLPRVIRSINLSARDPYAPPLVRKVAPDRVYLVNEVAFQIFLASELGRRINIADAVDLVVRENKAGAGTSPLAKVEFSREEIEEIRELSRRTWQGIPAKSKVEYLVGKKWDQETGELELETVRLPCIIPKFKGVGILGPCKGDAQFGKTLIEVKSGERDIRSIDIRQVIVYYVLNLLEGYEPSIEDCVLLNPRQGYRFRFRFADLMAAISGLSTAEFTANLRDYLVNWKACESP